MPTYITLMSYTQEGIEHIKEGPARLDAAKAAAKAAGGEIKAFYLVMGRYDAVIISEAPNDEAFAATTLAIASTGAIRLLQNQQQGGNPQGFPGGRIPQDYRLATLKLIKPSQIVFPGRLPWKKLRANDAPVEPSTNSLV